MDIKLILFRTDGEKREFALTRARVVLGRKDDCNIRIPQTHVSRRHCELITDDQGLLIRDLGSSNGTYVNGRRVQEVRIKPGDHLTVGTITFTVQIDGVPADIQPYMPAGASSAPAGPEITSDQSDETEVTEAPPEAPTLPENEQADPISALEALAGKIAESDDKTTFQPSSDLGTPTKGN